jgi:hypothetical protein
MTLGPAQKVTLDLGNGVVNAHRVTGNKIQLNANLCTVGSDWQLGGFAADPPTDDSSVGQLVQAIAAEGLNVPLSADTSQQSLLTTPQ